VFRVQLGRFRSMMRSMMGVAMRGVSVMRSGLMITGFVMPCGLAMMPGCVFVVLGCLMMMFCRFFGHLSSLRWGWVGSV
jgi:hypothetical protein